jgi:hypothetical protein
MQVLVHSPQRVGKGLFAYVTYRVDTKIGHGTPGTESEYCVYRRFRDFVRLHVLLQAPLPAGWLIFLLFSLNKAEKNFMK